jgi:hypothetical protein
VQTFLPYPGFAESAAALDDRRLGKQRVETFQILRALVWPAYGWKNHPAVAMWRGFVPALVSYGVAVCDEWTARGRADATRGQLLEFSGGREQTWAQLRDSGRLPPWIGSDDVHRSHQSSLLRKEPEHYRARFPDVPDDLPYCWPGSVFPRWPLRRGPLAELDVDDAARLCGQEQATEEQRAVVDSLRAGGRTPPSLAADDAGRRAALVAALALPGSTAWVVPGEPPQPGPVLRDRGEVAAGGSTSASIARTPGELDVAAMRAEASSPPELLFLHQTQTRTRRPPADVGLLVLEETARPRGWALPALVLTSASAKE